MGRLRWTVSLAVVLALAGCGDDEVTPADVPAPVPVESAPSATPYVTATTATPATAKPDRAIGKPADKRARPGGGLPAFLRAVQAEVPDFAVDRRDEEVEAVAEQACASLAAGEKTDAVVAETGATGTTDRATARELVELAVDTVCPDQTLSGVP